MDASERGAIRPPRVGGLETQGTWSHPHPREPEPACSLPSVSLASRAADERGASAAAGPIMFGEDDPVAEALHLLPGVRYGSPSPSARTGPQPVHLRQAEEVHTLPVMRANSSWTESPTVRVTGARFVDETGVTEAGVSSAHTCHVVSLARSGSRGSDTFEAAQASLSTASDRGVAISL